MKTLLASLTLIGLLGLFVSPVMAQQPGTLPTVVAKNTIPGNGDVDEDGDTDAVDAMFTLQIAETGKTGAGYPPSVRGFQQGDANHNGRLDRADARLINQHVAGLIRLPQWRFMRGDANGDGLVTATDGTVVLQFVDGAYWLPSMKYYNADANQDYFINRRDTDCILRMVSGLSCQ